MKNISIPPLLVLRLEIGLAVLVLASVSIYCIYLARLSYAGYCFAEGKYLSDREKVKVAVADVLNTYPPAVIRTLVEPGVWSQSSPGNPIYYRDVDEFLTQNPSCCEISLTRKELENTGPGFKEKVMGAVSSFVNMNYVVRYFDNDHRMQAIEVRGFLPLSNCGKPVRWWDPLQSDIDFIYQLIKNRGAI